jgi:pimeloyl-ACP methyl ester carboxylesterase
MATFVLVHGTHAGGWMWQRLAPLLREAGHDVHSPTWTGLGERVHLARPDVGLETYVQDVANVLRFEDLRAVVLVGSSFGGMDVAGAADRVPERLARLVYLDATVPEDGQSAADAWADGWEWLAAEREAAAAADSPDDWPVPTDYVRQMVSDEADQAWLLERFVPQPFAALAQPVALRNPAAAAIPRTYVRCTEEAEPEEPYVARARTQPGWDYRELAANHFAPFVAPHQTAELLLSLV